METQVSSNFLQLEYDLAVQGGWLHHALYVISDTVRVT